MKNIAKPNCKTHCGNIAVPNHFGIGEDTGCSLDNSFYVTCDLSFNPPKLFIRSTNQEIQRISDSELRIFTRVSYKCYNQTGFVDDKKLWYSSLANFTFSVKNMLTVIGCYDYGLIEGAYGVNFSSGCIGLCSEAQDVPDGQCSGKGCCQISITKGLKYYDVTLGTFPNRTSVWSFNKCAYVFLAEEGAFKFHGNQDLKNHLKFVDRTRSTVLVVGIVIDATKGTRVTHILIKAAKVS
ncbi:wall-associated receptor kinase 2-like protein [Tanacetum coccineum]